MGFQRREALVYQGEDAAERGAEGGDEALGEQFTELARERVVNCSPDDGGCGVERFGPVCLEAGGKMLAGV
jgi:hypothetical protein